MTPSSPPVRLVLVDDHEMVIEGLKAMLAAFSDRVAGGRPIRRR